jgi:hypothetical protein
MIQIPDSKLPFCTACFFSVCTGMYIYIACLTEYKECQAFCLFVWIGPPHPQASVAPPPLGPRGETHWLAGEGVGGPNSNEGTDTLVLYVYYNPSTACQHCLTGRGLWDDTGYRTILYKKITKKYSNNETRIRRGSLFIAPLWYSSKQ